MRPLLCPVGKPGPPGTINISEDHFTMRITTSVVSLSLTVFFCLIVTSACSTFIPSRGQDLPPVLAQDELIRPYTKLGRIQVTRETYGSDYSLTPDVKAWGFTAVRQEAAKIGAVILSSFVIKITGLSSFIFTIMQVTKK